MMDIEIEDNSQLQDTFVFTLIEMVELFNRFEIEWLEDFKGLKIQFTKNINVCGVLRSPDYITYIGQSIVLKRRIRMDECAKRRQQKENELKPKLTNEFLENLAEAGKVCGWSGDYHEISEFVEWCFDLAEKDRPTNMESYDYDYDL